MAAGLAYEQGPAFAAPMRLFLAAPLFLAFAAVTALPLVGDWLGGRWSPASLALTHLLTLGYLGTVMQGSLLQMLPVVLGTPVPRANLVAGCGLAGLAVGAPMLASGLLFGEPVWMALAGVALVLAWGPFLIGVGAALLRAVGNGEVAWPIRQSVLSAWVAVATGLVMLGLLAGLWTGPDLGVLVDLHVAWGVFGWVGILIVGVAYQVVPMLQLTPAYPRVLSKTLTWLLPAGLLAYSFDVLAGGEGGWLRWVAVLAAGGGALAFAAGTLDRLRRRRRRLPDVTLDFWLVGLAALALAVALYVALPALPEIWRDAAGLSLGLAFLLGFAASVVNGMLYKIVPFLAWFHLQSQTGARAGSIPNMREMIAEPAMRRHLHAHVAASVLLVAAPFAGEWAAAPGLLALAWSAHLLWINLLAARKAFRAHGGVC